MLEAWFSTKWEPPALAPPPSLGPGLSHQGQSQSSMPCSARGLCFLVCTDESGVLLPFYGVQQAGPCHHWGPGTPPLPCPELRERLPATWSSQSPDSGARPQATRVPGREQQEPRLGRHGETGRGQELGRAPQTACGDKEGRESCLWGHRPHPGSGVMAHAHSGEVTGLARPDFPAWGWMLTKPVTGQTCLPRSGQLGPLTPVYSDQVTRPGQVLAGRWVAETLLAIVRPLSSFPCLPFTTMTQCLWLLASLLALDLLPDLSCHASPPSQLACHLRTSLKACGSFPAASPVWCSLGSQTKGCREHQDTMISWVSPTKVLWLSLGVPPAGAQGVAHRVCL